MALIGFSAAFAVIPLYPEIMRLIEKHFQRDGNAKDVISALYNAAFGMGGVLGPVVGAHLTQTFGFKNCTDILSIAALCLFVVMLLMSKCKNILVDEGHLKGLKSCEPALELEYSSLSGTSSFSRNSHV